MSRDQKVENLALFIKNRSADVKAIREEEKRLFDRAKVMDRQITRAKQYLVMVLNGEKFQTPKVAVSYRRSTKVQLGDEFLEWAKNNWPTLLRTKEPEPDKTAIKGFLENGETIPYADLVTETSLNIK